MLLISTYQDLLIEIEIYKSRLEDLQREDYALRRIEYNKIDLETYVNRKHKVNNEAAILQAILDDKEETKGRILKKLNQLEGLEYQIAYKRFVEGKSLSQIAKEVNYSDSYIKKKSALATQNINENERVNQK